jgi:6-pyruvoyltetrahydropterin/6-carboxytetrahydropterin synthase
MAGTMAFEIQTNHEFAASHQLRLYDGALEQLHGHNWRVRVTVSAEKLDHVGLVMDFHKLERLVDQVLAPMRERHLNEVAAFAGMNPSAENVAQYIAGKVQLPGNVRLKSVEVWETPGNCAVYRP